MTLLFDAMTAYLGPLLKKHEAGQPLVWEDLMTSQTASSAVLRQSNNEFVSSRMDRLHQSQVKAYRDAATKSIKDWVASVPLQPMEEGDTKAEFVQRCVASIATTTVPNWHLATAKYIAITEIRNSATATYDKYHPADEVVVAKEDNGDDAGSTNEAGNGENGSETEDGEMTADDDQSVEDGEATAAKQTSAKYVHPNRNKKGAGNKVVTARKKVTKTKVGGRTIRGGRGARRGGRGNGNGK